MPKRTLILLVEKYLLHLINYHQISEMLKSLGNTVINIFKIYQCIWKKYRTIALISNTRKVMLQILSEPLKLYILSHLPPKQVTFVLKWGTRGQIHKIYQIIEKAGENNTPEYLCFLDYPKTSNCIWRQNNLANSGGNGDPKARNINNKEHATGPG